MDDTKKVTLPTTIKVIGNVPKAASSNFMKFPNPFNNKAPKTIKNMLLTTKSRLRKYKRYLKNDNRQFFMSF